MIAFPKVVVVGGAGYVGSALIPHLLDLGYRVKVIDLFLYSDRTFREFSGQERLQIVRADIRDSAMLERELAGQDAVIHLACVSNDPSFELDPNLGKSINYDAFLGLVDAARKNRIRRFIYASSSSVYGVREEPDVREETPCTPLTDYSKYKLLCEDVLRERAADAMEHVILRPATVCGFAPRLRLDLTVNILTTHALVNRKITVFGGSQLRPNIHIADMVEAYRVLLESPRDKVHGQVYNAGYENRSVSEIAQLVQEVVGDPQVAIVRQPTNDLRSYHINSDKIRSRLGFVATHTIADAVRDLCREYRAGKIPNALTDPTYYNVKVLKSWYESRAVRS